MTSKASSPSSSAEAYRLELLSLVELYKARHGLGDSGVARRFGRDAGLVAQIRNGEGITMTRAEAFENFLRRELRRPFAIAAE